LAIVLLFMAASCFVTTVNIYFPAAEMEKAAAKIVDEIEGGEDSAPSGTKEAALVEWLVPTAYAGDVSLDITTPAIRKLQASMKARRPLLRQYKEKGNIGEGKDGMMAIRTLQGLPGSERRKAAGLMKAENKDRAALYQELARANNIPSSEVGRIADIFAKEWRKRLKPGQWYRDDKATWAQKK